MQDMMLTPESSHHCTPEFQPSVSSLVLDCSFTSKGCCAGLEPGQTVLLNLTGVYTL